MKNFLIVLFLLGCILKVDSQTEELPYKYVVVPVQYEFLKGKDKFRLNTQTRFLLKQEGFEVYFEEGEELPEDLFKNRCLAMYADVHKIKGGFLKIKLKMSFKDCYGNIILESDEGTTKEKDLNIAYKEALERAFVTLDFSKLEEASTPEPSKPAEVAKVEDMEKETPKDTKTKVTDAGTEIQKTVEDNKVEVKASKEISVKSDETVELIYYAQKISGGFQLVDSVPKIVMILLETASPDIFLVKDKNAMVIKKEGQWYYSENDGGKPIEKPLNIKF